MATKPITDSSFEQDVLNADHPVLVDFWAEWCGPCRQIGPALEEISASREGEIVISKINIDENPEMPGKYGVRGIPTMMIFNGGELVATKVGAAPKSTLDSWIGDVLSELSNKATA